MKKYLIFGGDIYYPGGGFKDFIHSDDNREYSIGYAIGLVSGEGSLDWSQVVDKKTGEIIYESRDEQI